MDIIEAGFPVASEGDFESVKAIAREIGCVPNPPIICGLARTKRKDIEAAAEALKPAKFPRIHTFIACSDIHMKHKLKMTHSEVSLRRFVTNCNCFCSVFIYQLCIYISGD